MPGGRSIATNGMIPPEVNATAEARAARQGADQILAVNVQFRRQVRAEGIMRGELLGDLPARSPGRYLWLGRVR